MLITNVFSRKEPVIPNGIQTRTKEEQAAYVQKKVNGYMGLQGMGKAYQFLDNEYHKVQNKPRTLEEMIRCFDSKHPDPLPVEVPELGSVVTQGEAAAINIDDVEATISQLVNSKATNNHGFSALHIKHIKTEHPLMMDLLA